MTTAIITSKGRITIPANVRQALKVKSGDRVEFVETQPGQFELFVSTKSVRDLKGMFGKPDRHVSIDEMNKVSLSNFIEHRQEQREFIARGLASRDEAKKTGKYVSSDAVIGRLEKMLAKAKASSKTRE